jgi:hypothetical protein
MVGQVDTASVRNAAIAGNELRRALLSPCSHTGTEATLAFKRPTTRDDRQESVMRSKLLGLATVLAATATAAPAIACYYDGCGGYYALNGIDYSSRVYLGGCGYAYYGCGITYRERLPDLDGGPQYYFVNHGPTYTGPGNIAPTPAYQERLVSGWPPNGASYYGASYYGDYGYDGGPYANPINRYYDGAQGAVIHSYRWRNGRVYRTHERHKPQRPRYYYTERRPSYVRNSAGVMQKID